MDIWKESLVDYETISGIDGKIATAIWNLPLYWPYYMNECTQAAIKELGNINRQDSEDDDSDSSDGGVPGNRSSAPSKGLSNHEKTFVKELKYCFPFVLGFHLPTDEKVCYCVCSRKLEPWSKKLLIDQDREDCCSRPFTPNGLMEHLKAKGGRVRRILL